MPTDDLNQVARKNDPPTPQEPEDQSRIEIHIPLETFVKLFVAILLAGALYVLWPLLLLVFLALLLAVTLNAFVDWLTAHKVNRRLSIFLVIASVATTVALSLALILPVLIEQVDSLSKNLPKLREITLSFLPRGGTFRQAFESMLDSTNGTGALTWYDQFITAGGTALGGITQTLLLLIIAIYLLVDG